MNKRFIDFNFIQVNSDTIHGRLDSSIKCQIILKQAKMKYSCRLGNDKWDVKTTHKNFQMISLAVTRNGINKILYATRICLDHLHTFWFPGRPEETQILHISMIPLKFIECSTDWLNNTRRSVYQLVLTPLTFLTNRIGLP